MALRAGDKGANRSKRISIKQAVDLIKQLKCTESTQGAYVLTATVDAEGKIVYSWESAE